MRSRVMLYSFPMASNVRISPFGESPKRSVRTLRERSGNPESRSFVTDFGEIVSIEGIVDAQYIPCLTLYQVGGVVCALRLPIFFFHTKTPNLRNTSPLWETFS